MFPCIWDVLYATNWSTSKAALFFNMCFYIRCTVVVWIWAKSCLLFPSLCFKRRITVVFYLHFILIICKYRADLKHKSSSLLCVLARQVIVYWAKVAKMLHLIFNFRPTKRIDMKKRMWIYFWTEWNHYVLMMCIKHQMCVIGTCLTDIYEESAWHSFYQQHLYGQVQQVLQPP